jgi:hypothetical protein
VVVVKRWRSRLKLALLLAVVLVTPAAAQQCPAPPFYALLPHTYPCSLIRTCSTEWGICAIPFTVQPGTPCSCQAPNGIWVKGVCVR